MYERFADNIRSKRPARCAATLLVWAGVLFGALSVVHAQAAEKCRIPNYYKNAWNEAEEWTWRKICKGRVADFNKRQGNEELDTGNPNHNEKWANGRRTLWSDFLETILSKEPFSRAIPAKGVRIEGAYFKRGIDLDDISTKYPLSIEKSFFDSQARMRRFRTSESVSFNDSAFRRGLTMKSARIGGNLSMKRTRFNNTVRLDEAVIGGEFDLHNSVFKKRLKMESAKIGGELLMRNAQFGSAVELVSLKAGSNLDLRGVELKQLDLKNAQIKGSMKLESYGDMKIKWKGDAPKLILRNATVGTLLDTKDAWPGVLELDGFAYKHFGKGRGSVFDRRGSEWFVEWLAKDKTYTPQPYRHLASHLRVAGHGEMADDILIASRERERGLYNPWQSKWWGLLALKIGINYGYGLGYFLLLRFIVLFVAIGTVVLHIAGERKRHHFMMASFWDSAFYSLDMLLPLIRLRERHYTEVDLNRGARYYFYFHQVVGYLLVSIMLAVLIG